MLSVNPSDLEIAANVRKDVNVSKEFVKSVKTHGVLVPIIVTPGLQGYAVIDGQRRALAAVEAGLREVPVVVVDQLPEEKDRVITQLVVNDHREGVGMADTVAAVQELALFGMSATAIAKNLGEDKAAIDQALKVGKSEKAVETLRTADMDLEDAVAIAEFDDWPEAQADLIEKAQNGYYLRHEVQRWRDERGMNTVRELILSDAGIELIDPPAWSDVDPLEVRLLFTDEEREHPLTEEQAQEFSGRGLCAYPVANWEEGERVYLIQFAIRGWKELGLFTHPHIEDRGGAKKPTTPEEIEAAKAERREVRENTKAWKSATAVRLEWLQKILGRARMPKGYEVFVAQHVISTTGHSAAEWDLWAGLLHIEANKADYQGRRVAIDTYLAGAPQKAPAVMLASAVASVEGGYDFNSKGWRQESIAKPYLLLLQGWGYELSEIEAEVVG